MPAPRPMLRLSVHEITSVSATFILSSRLNSSIDPTLSSLGITDHYDHDEPSATATSVRSDTRSPDSPATGVTSSVIADALSKGLSVTVNGSAWPRTFIRIDEQIDEAVIIVYALMPGRQYDIELGLATCQNGHSQSEQTTGDVANPRTLRRQIVTQRENEVNEINTDPSENELSLSSSSSSSPLSTPSSSTSPTGPTFITPPPSQPPPPITPPPPTLSERLSQLHQTLSHLTTERDTLLASLKSLRRESQKADASLRAEIDTLKRTSDKNASFELRSRQKLLALQESVKRAQNAARESEEMTREVEGEILELIKKKKQKEGEHRRVAEEAGKVRKEREEVEEKETKRIDGMRTELNGLTTKLERLNGKRDRLEAVIPDLEAKVQDIEGEIEDAEREVAKLENEEQIRLQFEETYLQRNHHTQDTTQSSLWPPGLAATATATAGTSSTRLCPRTHNPKSQSMHITYPLPHRQSSLKTTSKSMSMNTSISTPVQLATTTTSAFLIDQPTNVSPISPSTRSSPGTSGMMNKGSNTSPIAGTGGYTSIATSPSVSDPLAVGAGRPSRKSFEATIWAGKNTE